MFDSIIDTSTTGSGPWAVPIVPLAPVKALGFTLRRRAEKCGRKPQSHCKNGHLLSERNLYVAPGGNRRCAICRKARNALRYGGRKPGNNVWQSSLRKNASHFPSRTS